MESEERVVAGRSKPRQISFKLGKILSYIPMFSLLNGYTCMYLVDSLLSDRGVDVATVRVLVCGVNARSRAFLLDVLGILLGVPRYSSAWDIKLHTSRLFT